jgi:hypothetical protein
MQMAAESGTSSIFSFNFSPYLPYQAKKQAVLFPIIAQSTDYRNKINKAPLKELHQLFPCLLSSIFGYNGTIGWGLKLCHKTKHPREFQHGYDFLSPQGDIFKLIEKLNENGLFYKFPIKCLPHSTQQDISAGVIPHLYHGKLHPPDDNQKVPDHVFLCILSLIY